ncbi:MAG: cyclic lactone autoinducer peptide [Thermoanaerobacteraceae bacterium]|nr:cyclic lactone autoinducer peptide [Thermoanaerobacteraceae bacterium]
MRQKIMSFVGKSLAGVLAAVALLEVGTTSMFFYHQPDIPEELKRK